MHSHILRHCVIASVLTLGACVSAPPHIFLPDAAHDKIVSTDVVLPVRQNEIYVFVPMETAGAGFGLVGALVDVAVDSARTSKAEAAVKPLRDATIDYTFDSTLQADMNASLSQMSFLGVDKVRVSKQTGIDGLNAELANLHGGAILVASADYRLDNDGNILIVTIGALMVPNNEALRVLAPPRKTPLVRIENAMYRNTIVFETRLSGSGSDRGANIAAWSADHGAPLRAALGLASKKVSALLAADLGRSASAADPAGAPATKLNGLDGRVVETDAEGTTLRFKDGTLAYVTKLVQ